MRIFTVLLFASLISSVAHAGRRELQIQSAENPHSVKSTQLVIGRTPKPGGALGGDTNVPANPDDQNNGKPLPQKGDGQHMKKDPAPKNQDQQPKQQQQKQQPQQEPQQQQQNQNNGNFKGFTKRAPGQTFQGTQNQPEQLQGGKDVVALGDNSETLDKILNHPPVFKGFPVREGCSVSDGSWNRAGLLARSVSPPDYNGNTCPFLAELGAINCLADSRRTEKYTQFTWQPADCRGQEMKFDAPAFVKLMTGKKIAFIGDSLMYVNMVPALLCQLNRITAVQGVPNDGTMAGQPSVVYRVPAYDITIVKIWSPFLVQASTTATVSQTIQGTADTVSIFLDVIDPAWGPFIKNYDLALFESAYHWQLPKTRNRIFYQGNRPLNNPPNFINAFTAAMTTVYSFLNLQARTFGVLPSIYFVTMPARSMECYNMTHPARDDLETLYTDNPIVSVWADTQDKAFKGAKLINLLDVTSSSLFRPDALVGGFNTNNDCVHWCLPGVPDTWLAFLQQDLGFIKDGAIRQRYNVDPALGGVMP